MNILRKKRTIRALGDGNCAINSFILGISEEAVLNSVSENRTKMPEFQQFIKKAAKALSVEKSWAAIKKEMLRLRKENADELQKKLAGIVRDIVIEFSKKNKDEQFKRSKEPLLSACYHYLCSKKLNILVPETGDDIYIKYGFITEEIDNLFGTQKITTDITRLNTLKDNEKRTKEENVELNVLEKQLDADLDSLYQKLLQWWEKKGFDDFLAEMKKNGEWAGDLELHYAAKWWGVNLDVCRQSFVRPHHIYLDCGVLSSQALDQSIIQQLVVRDIVNRPEKNQKTLALLPLEEQEMRARLDRVIDHDQVEAFIKTQMNPLMKMHVPTEWSYACTNALRKRNIIEPRYENNQKVGFHFIVDQETALQRIEAVVNKEKIAQAWKESRRYLPLVTLENQHGGHWDCVKFDGQKLSSGAEEIYNHAVSNLKAWKTETNKWEEWLKERMVSQEETSGIKTSAKEATTELNTKVVIVESAEKKVSYHLPKSLRNNSKQKTALFSRAEQIKADEELARQLQMKELDRLEDEQTPKIDPELKKELEESGVSEEEIKAQDGLLSLFKPY